jgi:hypothetical protein
MDSTLMTRSGETGVDPDVAAAWIVEELDGDELVAGELEHGQMAQGGLGHAADDLVADRAVEREGSVAIGHVQVEVQRPHRFSVRDR